MCRVDAEKMMRNRLNELNHKTKTIWNFKKRDKSKLFLRLVTRALQ